MISPNNGNGSNIQNCVVPDAWAWLNDQRVFGGPTPRNYLCDGMLLRVRDALGGRPLRLAEVQLLVAQDGNPFLCSGGGCRHRGTWFQPFKAVMFDDALIGRISEAGEITEETLRGARYSGAFYIAHGQKSIVAFCGVPYCYSKRDSNFPNPESHLGRAMKKKNAGRLGLSHEGADAELARITKQNEAPNVPRTRSPFALPTLNLAIA